MGLTIMILIGAIIILIGIIITLVTETGKEKVPIDYYALFLIGVIWIPAGVIIKNYGLAAIGLAFALVGVAYKEEWKKNRQDWAKLSKKERKMKNILLSILLTLFILGVILYYLLKNRII